ncbi:glycosyl hydrolase family 61-domain-containing protein [Pseudomassariella vexata]|uniref:lytic cellulose monooxygenase (C4-dehydrogenating) n=1 Tax=Pseudomassariella vexata TaxID=1141098 RepID=A0A1Y2DD48_9PEZI|nr:glycosyl hydrolase family 61-domain-containing protein [Pseudomassariella vexata]ORY56615.1 glycosyl hydrolase family 61-domain-containing protein [Pseudomassariella vexata]
MGSNFYIGSFRVCKTQISRLFLQSRLSTRKASGGYKRSCSSLATYHHSASMNVIKMKKLLSLPTLLATITVPVLAHWNYDTLIVNDTPIGSPYQYIRRTNNSNSPLVLVNSTDMRCNSGASSGITTNTSTYHVAAGSEVGFGIASTFGHPGPQQVYLSPVPAGLTAADYDGSGEWVKIYAATTQANTTLGPQGLVWATHNVHSFRFTLPAETPAGEYLLRAEGLALHAAHKLDCAQFYVGCAQIRVTGDGKGVLGPLVRIPGVYNDTEPGVLIPEFWSYMTNYTLPGPELWPEGMEVQHMVKQLSSNQNKG